MDSTLLKNLKIKENRCRTLQQQADEVYVNNNRQPSEEQCILLQRAADMESEMAAFTIGAERDHHIREKNRLDFEIMRIRSELERKNGVAKKLVNNDNGAAGKGGEKGGDEKSKDEQELDRAVRTWYKEKPRYSFDDVAGMDELKKKLKGCIADAQAGNLREYLKIPKLNSYFFVGPPGCGKTYIIEAFAHELMDQDYQFISILGSDIISKYVGAAEKSVTRLFEEAAKSAPCIVFVDEIDSLCKNRSLPNLPEYAANITTSFLTGYNRIHTEDSNVIFIAATNYPNRVDAAMLDRAEIIRLPLPDKAARSAAFGRYFDGIVTLGRDLSYDLMAERTWRFNYRDIERLTSALKLNLFRDVMDMFGDEALAIEMLKSGQYQLTLEKFDSVLATFKPSPKELIINDLVEWEQSVQSVIEAEETDLASLYDCEKPAREGSAAAPAEQPSAEQADAPVHTEPVYPLSKSFTVDPAVGIATIRFGVSRTDAADVRAFISGSPVKLEQDDDGYRFVYEPAAGETEVTVFVKADNRYLGCFTAYLEEAEAAAADAASDN